MLLLMISCKQNSQIEAYRSAVSRADRILVLQRKGDSLVLYKTITDSISLHAFRDIFTNGLQEKILATCAGNTQMVLYNGPEQIMRLSYCDDPEAAGITATGAGFSITFGMTYRMGMFPDGP